MSNAHLPSHHLPDFLKLDLGVATDRENPLVRTLDAFAKGLMRFAATSALALEPRRFDDEKRRAHLARLGFSTATLSEAEAERLFEMTPSLLWNRGTTTVILQLAVLYLGSAEVQRGRPLGRRPIGRPGMSAIQLVDLDDAKGLVFVQRHEEVSPERVTEFEGNAKRLLPAGYRLLVAQPLKEAVPVEYGIKLAKGLSMKERRL